MVYFGACLTLLCLYMKTGLGRIAGIVSLEVEGGNTQLEAVQRVGSEIAMHVVAAKPLFLSKDLVSSEASDEPVAQSA